MSTSIEKNGKLIVQPAHPDAVNSMGHDVVLDVSNTHPYPVHIEVAVNRAVRPLRIAITVDDDMTIMPFYVITFAEYWNSELRQGTPIGEIAEKHLDMCFWPKGKTNNPEIPLTSSLPDYVSRWLGHTFGKPGFLIRHPLKVVDVESRSPFIREDTRG